MTLKTVFQFLTFRWTASYPYFCRTNELTKEVTRLLKQGQNLEGQLNKTDLDATFMSDLGLRMFKVLPLLQVKGKIEPIDDNGQLVITTTLETTPKYMFLLAGVSILTFYFVDKYFDLDFTDISDSTFPLYAPLFIYCFLMLNFLVESNHCNIYFARLTDRTKNNAP